MFTRNFMSERLLPMVKYTISALLLVCLVVVQGVARDLDGNETIINLEGNEDINVGTYTLTLINKYIDEGHTGVTVYSGVLSGSGQVIITKSNWNSLTQLTLSSGNGYADFTGSVIVQGASTSEDHTEGKLDLSAENLFCSASNIANDGLLIVNANQILPNLSGSGKIQVSNNNYSLTFDNAINTESVYSGVITGTGGNTNWSGNIVKTGDGKLILLHDSGYAYFTGSVTVKAGTLELDGSNIFRSLSNDSVVTNNGKIIADGGRQFLPNLNGSGNIETTEYVIPATDVTPEILVKTSVTSYYSKDAEISGIISGPGNFIKDGPVDTNTTLTLSGANTILGEIEILNGTIRFTKDAIVATGEIDGATNGHVIYDVTDRTRVLYIPADIEHVEVKTITKEGDETLQIYEGAAGCVRAESFVISSGRVDYQGYFQSVGTASGTFDVKPGTTLSPGLTVDEHGEPINTIGTMEITNGVTINIKSNATLLFEFDAYNEVPTLQNFDKIVTEDIASIFAPELGSTSTIDLAFLSADAWKWAKENAEYQIVFDYNFPNDDYTYLLREQYRDYFSLVGKNNNGLYLVGKGAPEPPVPPSLAVPEPSSWALLTGSMLSLFFFLKKKR